MCLASRHPHQQGKGGAKTASDDPQLQREVCGGAARSWPQAGTDVFKLSLSYLEAPGAKMGVCGGPCNQERWPEALLHLTLPMPPEWFFLACIHPGLNI